MVPNAADVHYHGKCFSCFKCRAPIDGEYAIDEDDHPLCTACDTTNCVGCMRPIHPSEDYSKQPSGFIHFKCFNCGVSHSLIKAVCKKNLAEIEFFRVSSTTCLCSEECVEQYGSS